MLNLSLPLVLEFAVYFNNETLGHMKWEWNCKLKYTFKQNIEIG